MRDTCAVGITTSGELDPVTLEPTTEFTEHYAGKCRISSASNAVSEKNAAGQQIADQALVLNVPVEAGAAIVTNDSVTITAIDAVSGNPAMLGRKFRIAGLASESQATAARFSLELIS